MSGEQMRLTAVDLINEAIKMSGLEFSRRHERPECGNLGYQVVSLDVPTARCCELPVEEPLDHGCDRVSQGPTTRPLCCAIKRRPLAAITAVSCWPQSQCDCYLVNAPTQEIAMVHARSFLGTRATGPVARGSPFLDELVLSGSGQLRYLVLRLERRIFRDQVLLRVHHHVPGDLNARVGRLAPHDRCHRRISDGEAPDSCRVPCR